MVGWPVSFVGNVLLILQTLNAGKIEGERERERRGEKFHFVHFMVGYILKILDGKDAQTNWLGPSTTEIWMDRMRISCTRILYYIYTW